jgi:hypothetical protein
MDTTKLVPLAITLAALYAVYRWGPGAAKGMALGAAGVVLLNQIPVVKQGLNAPLLTAAA